MKHKIQKESLVRITKPEIFVRCGYPLDFEQEKQTIKSQFRDDINALINKISIRDDRIVSSNCYYYDKVVNALTYASLSSRNFGGNNRSIHTKTEPDILHMICRVMSIRYVVTGIYQRGYNGGMWEDSEPTELVSQKRHRILYVCPHTNIDHGFNGTFEIEECHVSNLMPDFD